MSDKSLSERKKQFLEDCCGGGPTMSMGDAGFQADAPAAGPTAGFDPMLGKKKKKKVMGGVRRLTQERYLPIRGYADKKLNKKLDTLIGKLDKMVDDENQGKYRRSWKMEDSRH
jgi:hypothetical protein